MNDFKDKKIQKKTKNVLVARQEVYHFCIVIESNQRTSAKLI
jgi:hypothetical protein